MGVQVGDLAVAACELFFERGDLVARGGELLEDLMPGGETG